MVWDGTRITGIVNHWFSNEAAAETDPTSSVTEQLVARKTDDGEDWDVYRHFAGRLPNNQQLTRILRPLVPHSPGVEASTLLKGGLTLRQAYDLVRRSEENPVLAKGRPVLRQYPPDENERPYYWRNIPSPP